jgi:hypothetical protein
MNRNYKTLEDLTDSRILYEKGIPPFGYWIVIVIALLMAGIFVWGMHAPKLYG